MKIFLDNYFKANTWIVFWVMIFIYFISITIELKYIFTDSFYFEVFDHKKSIFNIQDFIKKERTYDWLNYLAAFIVVLLPSLIVAFILNIGVIFYEYKVKFRYLFVIVLKSQIIFAINYIISTMLKWQGVIERNYGNINNNYDYQSLRCFFNNKELAFWLNFPLEKINITEFIYILFLSYGFALISNKNYMKCLGFVLIFYGLALIGWIIFTVFIQTLLYN